MTNPSSPTTATTTSPEILATPEWLAVATHQAVPCPLMYLRLLGGDAKSVLFLQQVIYWQQRARDPAGWVYKTATDWRAELGYSDYEVRRCCKVLAPFGLAVKVEWVGNSPVRHYRVALDVLAAAIWSAIEVQTAASRPAIPTPEAVAAAIAAPEHQRESAWCSVEELPGAAWSFSDVQPEESGSSYVTEITSERTTEPTAEIPPTPRAAGGAQPPTFRAACADLVRERYGADYALTRRDEATIAWLWDHGVTVAQVTNCWYATARDPWWDAHLLRLATLQRAILAYRRDPGQYRIALERKRALSERSAPHAEHDLENGSQAWWDAYYAEHPDNAC